MAFSKHSEAEPEEIQDFLQLLVRLFSTLHVTALAQLEDCQADCDSQFLSLPVLDVEGIDDESIRTLQNCSAKVELVCHWIQQMIVGGIKTEVMSIPSPILSRCFQLLTEGMMSFTDAVRIARVPFPFPYAQVCDSILFVHWALLPFVISTSTTQAWWGGVYAFVQVFFAWSLTFIAVELEQPFGFDANDLDSRSLQEDYNKSLLMLVQPEIRRTPVLSLSNSPRQSLSELEVPRASAVRCRSLSEVFSQTPSSASRSSDEIAKQRSSEQRSFARRISTVDGKRASGFDEFGDRVSSKISSSPKNSGGLGDEDGLGSANLRYNFRNSLSSSSVLVNASFEEGSFCSVDVDEAVSKMESRIKSLTTKAACIGSNGCHVRVRGSDDSEVSVNVERSHSNRVVLRVDPTMEEQARKPHRQETLRPRSLTEQAGGSDMYPVLLGENSEAQKALQASKISAGKEIAAFAKADVGVDVHAASTQRHTRCALRLHVSANAVI
eukprot:CAMPEP_0169251912 /NCGR_PEP_ID=MMETSP1016-20121227/37774_1 /TAXON_ID=342587 /ORGANISM="Karlodinium micrum, Strain CCMP2283" /LENGTH=494 /DNA_ID=CAMNT_0009333097 /DNA_START=281 /DNA_END=1766 /DNA_ORIENTATION=-